MANQDDNGIEISLAMCPVQVNSDTCLDFLRAVNIKIYRSGTEALQIRTYHTMTMTVPT
jgi:hypothetical protein